MTSFKELLKEVENDNKAGFKNGAWFPHKSAEGGTRTLGYGHKLSQQEEDGGYVVLPDGKVVDFSNRGLTDKEIEQLLDADVQKHKSIAATQWNNSQKTPFSSLPPIHQSLLTEIAFNIGGLKNDKGKWGWPSLAEGILNNDPEKIKAELMRSYTDKRGNKKPLTKRVDRIRGFFDQATTDPQSVVLESFDPEQDTQEPEMAYSKLLQDMMASALDTLQQPGQRAPQTPSRSDKADPVEELMAYMDKDASEKSLKRVRNEQKLETTYNQALAEEDKDFSAEEEKSIQALMKYMDKGKRVQVRETTNPPKEQPQESQERVKDDSKDPIYGIF